MLEHDRERLEQAYPLQDGRPVGDLGVALGLRLEKVRELLVEVRNDLDVTVFGIGWWRTQGETQGTLQQRILIGDYLIDALQSVESNLIDLSLHLLELQDWWAREARFVRDAIQMGPNGPLIRLPPRLRPSDDLNDRFVDLHTAGIFRSVASVLDCLASVVIGVGAVESDILRGDWSILIKQLAKLVADGTPGRELQLSLRSEVNALLAAGSLGWDRWASDFRNTLVHRGRRVTIGLLVPESSVIDSNGSPIVRAAAIHLLARDPSLSHAEAQVLGSQVPPVLTENAHMTISGMVTDLSTLVDGVAGLLLKLWKTRRETPALLVQPAAKQWPKVRRSSDRSFAGYHPGQCPYHPSAMNGHPEHIRRLKAASLEACDVAKTWPRGS
jgi:hypothetical protein